MRWAWLLLSFAVACGGVEFNADRLRVDGDASGSGSADASAGGGGGGGGDAGESATPRPMPIRWSADSGTPKPACMEWSVCGECDSGSDSERCGNGLGCQPLGEAEGVPVCMQECLCATECESGICCTGGLWDDRNSCVPKGWEHLIHVAADCHYANMPPATGECAL